MAVNSVKNLLMDYKKAGNVTDISYYLTYIDIRRVIVLNEYPFKIIHSNFMDTIYKDLEEFILKNQV